jgi:hypothetical protein
MLPPTELGLVDGRMGAPPARENALRAGDALDASENALISNRAQLSTAGCQRRAGGPPANNPPAFATREPRAALHNQFITATEQSEAEVASNAIIVPSQGSEPRFCLAAVDAGAARRNRQRSAPAGSLVESAPGSAISAMSGR